MDLLNPTSGRDVSHPCLISTWPKEWCTTVCVIVEETNLYPIRYCSLWEWAEESIPPSRICSISHQREMPSTLALQALNLRKGAP